MNYWHNFANNGNIIINYGSKYMFMGMRNSFKMVKTTSKVPGVTIFQNGKMTLLAKILLIIIIIS